MERLIGSLQLNFFFRFDLRSQGNYFNLHTNLLTKFDWRFHDELLHERLQIYILHSKLNVLF